MMDFIDALQAGFLTAAAGALLLGSVSVLRDRLLAYGPRLNKASSSHVVPRDDANQGGLAWLVDSITNITVPHDFFWHFYLLSTSLSLYWALEILVLRGPTFNAIVTLTRDRGVGMSFEQVKITWLMMFAQGLRRSYECLYVNAPSKSRQQKSTSRMQAWIWALGLGFYAAMSVAVWVEAIPALQRHELSSDDLKFRAPTLRTIVAVLIFILASGVQHDIHAHLANLKNSTITSKSSPETALKADADKTSTRAAKTPAPEADHYKLPTHPLFQSFIAPHYTAECFIYLSLTIVAAPRGQWINATLASALVFVVVNLGVTASGTRAWYEKRFGRNSVEGKRNLIPFVY